jgi:DNA-binding MarR family transcriptional regulator
MSAADVGGADGERAGTGTPRARAERIDAVLAPLVRLSRVVQRARRMPFEGRVRGRTDLEALFLLAHATEPITPGRLAEELDVTPGAVTQLVDRLRADGILEQHPHPDDARSRIVRLTADAEREVGDYERAVVDTVAPAFAELDDEELAQLAELLARAAGDTHPR